MPGSFIEKLLTSAIKNDRSYLVLVSGQQGIGKTSFAIHAAYIAYGNYAKALRRLYFEASDFFKDTASFTEPQLVAVFDDAGVWLSRQRWYEKDVVYLGNLLQLARNLFRLVIFTTPSENLPRQVITHLNYVVRAIGIFLLNPLPPVIVAKRHPAQVSLEEVDNPVNEDCLSALVNIDRDIGLRPVLADLLLEG